MSWLEVLGAILVFMITPLLFILLPLTGMMLYGKAGLGVGLFITVAIIIKLATQDGN